MFTYDDIQSSPNHNNSLYFDALGWDSVSRSVFDHYRISRWWIYGEGSEKTYLKYLMKNRKGTFYSNLADSYIYQLRNCITDADMLEQCRNLIEKYNLEQQWYGNVRKISSSQEVFEIYQAYINNSHSGEKVVYQSPLYEAE